MWNVRIYKIGVACGLTSQLDWVARSSREITIWLVVLFCPVVLQLSWLFTFWDAWHVCCIWRLAATRSSREPPLFCKTWRFTFFSNPSINTPHTHKWKRASRENFERETTEKNKIDIPTIYTLESLQIPQLSSSPLSNPLKGILPKPCSHYIHYCERAVWFSGKQLGRNQSTLVNAMVK